MPSVNATPRWRSRPNRPTNNERCADCLGTGEIVMYRNVEDGPMYVAVYTCAPCRGSGWLTRSAARAHVPAFERLAS